MRKFSKKTVALVASIALLLCIGVGGTLAFLLDMSGPVENTFKPTKVTTYVEEKFNNGVKSEVKIQNTGDIDANIRAAIVVTWQNEAGDVLAQTPVKQISDNDGADYAIALDLNNGWTEKNDGYYYWTGTVAPNGYTGVLINECKQLKAAPVEGYYLCVEILGSGIQSVGIPAGNHPWYD